MKLKELKITSYLYNKFTSDDSAYVEFCAEPFDLKNKSALIRILRFLRSWGCRQFKIDDENISINSLQKWVIKYFNELPNSNVHLVDEQLESLKNYEDLFSDLMESLASIKNHQGKKVKVKFGPVGAAKLLFALRKNYFPPWDNPIIEEFKLKKNGEGYCNYLNIIHNELKELKEDCIANYVNFYELSSFLSRENVSLTKFADEYLWVSITRNCKPKEILKLISK